MILHLSQDDPKKCSARKLARFGMARLVERMDMMPAKALLLDPFCGVALSPADRPILISRGICAVDCSWEKAEEVFKALNKRRKMVGRTLPLLMASNPVKFGRWGELSTLEALAASYFIMGEREFAERMLGIYNWGVRFLEVNKEPLEAYAACSDGASVIKAQQEFL